MTMKSVWIARDKNGWSKLWTAKPRRGNYHWHMQYESMDSSNSVHLDDDLFSDINWDGKPKEYLLVSKEQLLTDLSEYKFELEKAQQAFGNDGIQGRYRGLIDYIKKLLSNKITK